MSTREHSTKVVALVALAVLGLAGACGGDDPASDPSGGAASASSSSGAGGGEPECFVDPVTHVEIINACTDAEKVDKAVSLPLLNSDGSLPPLP